MKQAVAESLRIASRSFVINWLNQSSLLKKREAVDGGSEAYHCGYWHTAKEVFALVLWYAGMKPEVTLGYF